MYNLIRLIVKYQVLLLFLLLELIALMMVFRGNHFQRTAMMQTGNEIAGKYYQSVHRFRDYLYLSRYNDSLVQENARLRARMVESAYNMQPYSGVRTDTFPAELVQIYDFIPAEVIRNNVNQAVNMIMINRGSKHGVQAQMGVISPEGVVGQVVSVTENYSSVMSLLNKNFKVSARLSRSGYFGNLAWTGKSSGSALLTEIPKHVMVKPGDTVVTSGYSLMFPRNIPVGRVSSVNVYPDQDFMDIQVNLSTGFGNLGYVYVVKDLRKQELVKLDSTIVN